MSEPGARSLRKHALNISLPSNALCKSLREAQSQLSLEHGAVSMTGAPLTSTSRTTFILMCVPHLTSCPVKQSHAEWCYSQGQFFFFHRYFTWLYERALQEECGYKGTQPYWDWTISWEDPRQSTVFDGSAWSMGSNGQSIPHGPTNISAFGINAALAPATGGGCTYSGPFANLTVNLGPVAFKPYGPDHGLGYNPRCLVRDLSPVWSSQLKPTDVIRVLSSFTDLGSFDTAFEALDGVHAGGHFTMGGLGGDAFSSSGDPAFYLHHAQVDRIWTIWQNLNAENRTNQVYGTNTAFNGEWPLTSKPCRDLMGRFPLLTSCIEMTSPAERKCHP